MFDKAYNQVKQLVEDFKASESHFLSATYSEAEVRKDFIDKFFTILGWDVDHHFQKNPFQQEVKVEKAQRQEGHQSQKRADYAFSLAPDFKRTLFFVEAKKPSRLLRQNKDDYFQTAKYGWNSQTGISILTDFQELVIIDCRFKPDFDTILKNEIKYYRYEDYANEDVFSEIYWLFSREAIVAGNLTTFIESLPKPKAKEKQLKLFGGKYQSIDESFLNYIDDIRLQMAQAFHANNSALDHYDLTEATQRTIDRLVFIRFLEDKQIEPEDLMHSISTANYPWQKFIEISKRLDAKYNGVVFKEHFIDKKTFLGADEELFRSIAADLDHTNTPYDFNYIPIHILGNIYERFLGKFIVIENGKASIELKPEVRKAGGVFYTPKYIVDYIVENTVGKLIVDKKPKEIAKLTFADIACGSGSFLIGVFDYLLDYHKNYYNEHTDEAEKDGCKYDAEKGVWTMSINQKKQILINNVYGVDIDLQATEVTQVSLFLKLLEDETMGTVAELNQLFVADKILPDLSNNIKCGNSLIGTEIMADVLDFGREEMRKLNPFDFETAFPNVFRKGGFDAIVGNPPYFSLTTLDSTQLNYFKNKYKVFDKGTDIYCVFFEKSMNVLTKNGVVAFITSNQWLQTNYGRVFRNYISAIFNPYLLINFGGIKIFKDATVDSSILLIEKKPFKNNLNGFHYKNVINNKEPNLSNLLFIKVNVNNEKWEINNEDYILLKNKIKKNQILKYYDLNINYGIKTGFNEAFIIDERKRNELISKDSKNAEIIKPILRGRDTHKYFYEWKNLFLIVSKNGVNVESDYPSIYEHFLNFGEKIKKRSDQGEHWWNLRACSYYNLFEGEKIIYPETTVRRSEFCFTNEEVYLDKTCFMITGSDLKFLNGVLSSKLMEWFLESELRLLGKTSIQYSKQYIEKVPIPKITSENQQLHDDLVKLVEQMLKAKKEEQNAQSDHEKNLYKNLTESLDYKINNLVYKLYNLTPEEIDLVENS
ncbi:MAG: Eco57I restriction-modification methylase domain-containing protein [Cloacibacterium sp.]